MDRKERMGKLKNRGLSYQKIGGLYGISRQRVHQIISDYKRLNRSLGQDGNSWYKKIKAGVLERDDNKCQKCDCQDNLLIHHINGNDNNNDLSNLITLCSRCHLELHRPTKSFNQYNTNRRNIGK